MTRLCRQLVGLPKYVTHAVCMLEFDEATGCTIKHQKTFKYTYIRGSESAQMGQ